MRKPDWNLWIRDKEECKKWLSSYTAKKILVKSRKESDFYFKKSLHNLNFANWNAEKQPELKGLFGENFYDWAVVGYYYAIYHAALALVSELGYKSRSHIATLCFLIHYYFHSKSLLEKENIELIAEAIGREDIEAIIESKSLRERASYDVHETFEKGLVESIRNKAVKFIEKTRTILKL